MSRQAHGVTVKPKIVVAGSGAAGIACAARLAEEVDVVVIERLPVAGGEEWEHPVLSEHARQAADAGAQFLLGTQAIRWDSSHVLAIGQESAAIDAAAVVVATGHRPLTRWELGLYGPRCAGVFSGTVALHLLRHRVRLGDAPIVVGGGALAASIAHGLRTNGARKIIVVAPDGQRPDVTWPQDIQLYDGASPVAIDGFGRVCAVDVSVGGGTIRLACDAMILAHGSVPLRNIDGAISRAPGVIFAQREGSGASAAEDLGAHAAEETLMMLAGVPVEHHTAVKERMR